MEASQNIVKWQAPSNIALIKYWGKKADQLPLNPSLSFTLKKSHTITSVEIVGSSKLESDRTDFYFENNPTLNDSFGLKFDKFIKKHFNFPKLKILSYNSFPHSTGIASSASSFAALSLCLVDLQKNRDIATLLHDASNFARLGSGSASRSLFGPLVAWGKNERIVNSSDTHAIKVPEGLIHETFNGFKDAILVVDSNAKKLSSTSGHAAFNQHPFKEARVKQANSNFNLILDALKKGDTKLFFQVVEDEALTLHSLIMTSDHNPILLNPNSLVLIQKIQDLRNKTGLSFGYTLDAGPNIHLLYAKADEFKLFELIENELKPFCENGTVIYDEVGMGPLKLL